MSVVSYVMQSIEPSLMVICAAWLKVNESQLPVYKAEQAKNEIEKDCKEVTVSSTIEDLRMGRRGKGGRGAVQRTPEVYEKNYKCK